MNTVIETITPSKAQEYLRTSNGNRPISKPFVNSYSDTMKKGAWMLNGVPIVFDLDGHLLDGHHRLLAVIDANLPVTFNVCRGVEPDAFTTFDNGRHREVGQLLAMQGVKHYNLIGSIIRANERLIKSGRLYANNGTQDCKDGRRLKTTNAEYYDLFRKDPEGYEAVAEKIVSLQGQVRMLPGSWAGGLYYYLTHTGGYTEEEVAPFFEHLYSLEEGNICKSVSLLRKVIVRERLEGRNIKADMLWAYIVKTWNYYITETAPSFLRYVPEREATPELILK